MAKVRGRKKKAAWRDPNDWYCEDQPPVHSLFEHIEFEGLIYDPCCGRGNILDVARSRGFQAVGSDIINRGAVGFIQGDFTDRGVTLVKEPANIIFNPPYSKPRRGICVEMIMRALQVATHRVCALVPVTFLGSIERHPFFTEIATPTQVAILCERPSMPPGAKLEELGKKAFKGGRIVYCWLIWDLHDPKPQPTAWLPAWRPA